MTTPVWMISDLIAELARTLGMVGDVPVYVRTDEVRLRPCQGVVHTEVVTPVTIPGNVIKIEPNVRVNVPSSVQDIKTQVVVIR